MSEETREATHAWLDGCLEPMHYAHTLADDVFDLLDHLAAERRVRKLVAEAARDLYERVEMDEAVGICLSDRVPSLRLAAALAESGALDQETGEA